MSLRFASPAQRFSFGARRLGSSAVALSATLLATGLLSCGRGGGSADVQTDGSAGAAKTAASERTATAQPGDREAGADACLPLALAEFGDFPLGASLEDFPREYRVCGDRCELTGPDGVTYEVQTRRVSAKHIHNWTPKPLPLGMTRKTNIAQARAALARHRVTKLSAPGEGGGDLEASVCDGAYLELDFDALGGLSMVRLGWTGV